MNWFQIKVSMVDATGLHMDALHVHAGIFLQVAAALLMRRSLASPLPLVIVLIAVLGNEIYDFNYEVWPNRWDQLLEGFRDSWNTLLLPTLFLLLTRFAPRLFKRSGR